MNSRRRHCNLTGTDVGCLPGALFSRRRFVQYFALIGAGWFLKGQSACAAVLTRIQAQPAPEGGLLKLRLRDFPSLQQELGSVRIGTSIIGFDHYPTGLFYPVLINRAPGGRFYALDSACSHEGCTVPTLDAELRLMQCLCHGSQYEIDGTVRRGPANFPLRQFTTHFDGTDSLVIELPDISFALEAIRVVQPVGGRIQIEFIAFEQIDYEVHFRPDICSDWGGPVSFSLSADGPADETSLRGAANLARVFLDQPGMAGLYAVAMRTGPV